MNADCVGFHHDKKRFHFILEKFNLTRAAATEQDLFKRRRTSRRRIDVRAGLFPLHNSPLTAVARRENTVIISLFSTNWSSGETDEDHLSAPHSPPHISNNNLNFKLTQPCHLKKLARRGRPSERVCAWSELPLSETNQNLQDGQLTVDGHFSFSFFIS